MRSASGTNTAGETGAPPFRGRRSSASNPASPPSVPRWIGWKCRSNAVIGDGLAEHALELPPRLQLRIHLRPEKALAARSLGLGMEEGDVGALHQRLGILAMGGRERGADAGGAFDVAVLQMERLAQC